MARNTARPGRTLLIFFISIGVLYGLAALGQTWKPRLGLDLEGGTQITLTAISGKDVTSQKLQQAADIINARVNGSGVAEADVTTQGNRNIIVAIPGKNAKDLVDSVKRTAQLRFRVVAEPGGTASPQVTPQVTTPSVVPNPTTKASPSGKPRVAPNLDFAADPTPSPKPGATPSATPDPTPSTALTPTAAPTTGTPVGTGSPSSQPSAPTQPAACVTAEKATVLGSKSAIADVMKWRTNPEPDWLACYAATVCPPKGETSNVVDKPDLPMVACDDTGNKLLLSRSIIEGTQLKTASAGIPQNSTAWAVNLSFKGSAKQTFGEVTKALFDNGGQFAIVLDGQVISYAGVNEPILDGSAQITGSFSETEALSLANSLKFGALPIRFHNPPTVETIGPSLAGNQLSAGIFAGIVGLAIVMIYCLLYYRGLGLVVVSSLFVAAGATYAVVLVLAKAASFTLTLPGIAGLIVAVGITADSFIVYFERIRDEMRDGKSMRVAVEAGWIRARNTCLAADAVSLLAAVVLYTFAIGVVRGFAFALGISTIIDVAVFFWFTKPTVSLLAKRTFFNSGSPMSGLSPASLGIDGEPRAVGGRA